jgi:hypothetical protein
MERRRKVSDQILEMARHARVRPVLLHEWLAQATILTFQRMTSYDLDRSRRIISHDGTTAVDRNAPAISEIH